MRTTNGLMVEADRNDGNQRRATMGASDPLRDVVVSQRLGQGGITLEVLEGEEASDAGEETAIADPSAQVRSSQRLVMESQARRLYGGHELANNLMVAVDAAGIYVRDASGREYIDCASGTFDQPLGHRHPALVEAMKRQIDELAYVGSPFVGSTMLKFAEKLVSVAPPNLTRVHLRDLTGSTAIEGAIKIAQAYTGKRDVISMFTSHHGQTSFTTGISGNSFRRALYPVSGTGAIHVPPASCSRCFYKQTYPACDLLCVDRINDFIEYASSGSVAALVVEPVQGNGGNILPPRDYFRKLKKLCDTHGILMIFDEVQTGMGRLGYMFAAEYFDVQPHIMVLAKGLGGPAPRGAILLEERLEKMPRYQHSSTGGSSLISAATALATLEVMDQPGFLEEVRRVGGILGDRLVAMKNDHAFIGDVRGVGMMWGLEIVHPAGSPDVEKCNRIAHDGRDFGLILRTSRYGFGNVIKVRPPLITTEPQVRELCDRLGRLLDSVS